MLWLVVIMLSLGGRGWVGTRVMRVVLMVFMRTGSGLIRVNLRVVMRRRLVSIDLHLRLVGLLAVVDVCCLS